MLQVQYFEPTAQEILNGELGLTSQQIADSLKIRHSNLLPSIRNYEQEIKCNLTKHSVKIKPGSRGRNSTLYVLTATDAKMIVARYQNEIGRGYLKFLLECEKIATEITPRLVARVKELEKELQAALKVLETKQKRLSKPKTLLVTENISKFDSLMGDGQIIKRHMTKYPVSMLTPHEIKRAKLVMMMLQQEGLAKAIKNLADEIDYAEQPPAQRLRLIKSSSPSS